MERLHRKRCNRLCLLTGVWGLVEDGDGEAVVGDFDVFGEAWLDVGLQPHVVAQMGEVGDARAHLVDDGEGLLEVHVGDVLFDAQCVDDQCVDASEYGYRRVGNIFGIGDVGEIADAVAYDGEAIVHHGEGDYFDIADEKWF